MECIRCKDWDNRKGVEMDVKELPYPSMVDVYFCPINPEHWEVMWKEAQ